LAVGNDHGEVVVFEDEKTASTHADGACTNLVGLAFILATNWTLVTKAGIGLELMAMTPDIFLDGLRILGHLCH
jgi:hypothetical protein